MHTTRTALEERIKERKKYKFKLDYAKTSWHEVDRGCKFRKIWKYKKIN